MNSLFSIQIYNTNNSTYMIAQYISFSGIYLSIYKKLQQINRQVMKITKEQTNNRYKITIVMPTRDDLETGYKNSARCWGVSIILDQTVNCCFSLGGLIHYLKPMRQTQREMASICIAFYFIRLLLRTYAKSHLPRS